MLIKLRRLLLGRGCRGSTLGSAIAGASRAQPGTLVAGPTLFSEPPREQVDLPDDLPWELREDDSER